MQTLKQELLQTIQHLPDNIEDMEEVHYRLYVLENIRRGQQEAEQGLGIPAEQLLKEIEQW